MKQANLSVRPSISMLLVAPAAIFFCFSLAKYELGLANPYDVIAPLREKTDLQQSIESEHTVVDPARTACRLFVLAVGGN
ncbi:MAG TPA: hypothetical protein VFZ42_01730 [Chitinophagaceae bacterium]